MARRHGMRRRAQRVNRRPGVASLELVLSLPFLLFLMAGIFSIAFAGLGRSEAAAQARLRAFVNRTGAPGAKPFAFSTAGNSGYAWARASVPVSVHPVFKRAGLNQLRAESELTVADGSWDYRQAPFDGSGPHQKVFEKIVRGGADEVQGLSTSMPLAGLLGQLGR